MSFLGSQRTMHKSNVFDKTHWSQRLVILGIILFAIAIALWQLVPPNVIPATAPLTEFSADRAMPDLTDWNVKYLSAILVLLDDLAPSCKFLLLRRLARLLNIQNLDRLIEEALFLPLCIIFS
jgi:hypothetical protein